MTIKITISIVIYHTPCGSHNKDAAHKNENNPGIRMAIARNPQCPQRWPQQ
jgi:hypothetical protein